MVSNLVDNALRHNVTGGSAEVATGVCGGFAVLSVPNTGPVVPASQAGRIFQPFQRLDGERAASRDGLGLGLPIANAIAVAHGGILRARPLPAGGLTVEAWLPTQGSSRMASPAVV